MSNDVQTRLVHVEFLRPGPPHNQLLSPLTQYLAISGDSGAGVVTVPYEQAEFSRRLKQLRYDTGDPEDRSAMLHSTGVEMSKILGAVPGLAGALTMDANHQGTLIQLRITLSASELAMLPFELAKAPVSATNTAENWLSIQTRPPVCITRNIRTVSPEGVVWPEQPRILFISGNPADVPYEQHHQALLKAIEPFQYPDHDDLVVTEERREQFGRLLTVLVDPTIARVRRECRENEYTHVHILTHGDLSDASPDSYGIVMRGEDGLPEVVSGDQIATALASVNHRPTVVTVASCDSGNVNQVAQPGASFAHALHQSGIPLVVASQFPLSKPGSVPLAATLYDGLLWGTNPLLLLRELRGELHTVYSPKWHDWASLVVYEALPQALNEQLERLRYFQIKRAINATLERIDRAVKKALAKPSAENLEKLHTEIASAAERLPLKGPYSAECIGIRASASKRLAQAAFNTTNSSRDPYDLLEQAYIDYQRAADSLLVISEGPAQRVATLHWLLVQLESLDMILGREGDGRRWTAAQLSAEMYRHHPDTEQRAWAHGSMAELFLVQLGKPGLQEADREALHRKVVDHARELVKLYPLRTEFPVTSTRRQFERYADWWGSQKFEDGLKERGMSRRASWGEPHGVTQVAKEVVKIMQRSVSPADKPPLSGPPGGNGGGAPEPPPKPGGGGKPRGGGSLSRRARTKPFFNITMLPAGHGDSLWIEYGGNGRDMHRVLVDCGTQQTARELLKRVAALPKREQFFDLFILSHIDSDHIGGALPFFKAVRDGLRFGDVWFNGWRHLSDRLSARQGEMFSTAIQDLELPWNVWMDGRPIVIDNGELPTCTLPGGMELTLLSPTPKQLQKLAPIWTRELKRYGLTPGARMDYSQFLKAKPSTSTDLDELSETPFSSDAAAPNGSSIAVLASYDGAAALLGADAHAPVLTESLAKLLPPGQKQLKIDAFKVSHHASQNNVSKELVSMLDCPRFLVSSNGAHFNHPDREAIARIIKYGKRDNRKPELIFNYRTPLNDVWEGLQDRYGFTARYPTEEPGQVVSLLPE